MAVLGVDGCPQGWVGVVAEGSGACALVVGPTVAALVAQVPDVRLVAVDIPVGLSDDGPRLCDVVGRRLLGRRASTLFLTPVRAAVEAATYAEANTISRAVTGSGVSRQAYALRARILEVDRWAPTAGIPVHEVHPELSFARMQGDVLPTSKHRPEGIAERRAALAAAGMAGMAAADGAPVPFVDVLDASACAWTARRIAAGLAERVGPDDGPAIFV